ncbi:KR-domain-containing protein [Aspergillus eucalypticola CBS 122712]|uniref:KR-domain-containing protein n=1 Tax=Aspergillus eucalypticola (strain CBS 122712 / IBT 29274) TaxID=1448314 RepID=A0A317UUF8_ASPEC|nr:KR-domain-containing protein [Aspergillus eucalypticola CBS 122712]PWY63680.1 KR-domain-containing protein [Aspergillus eucalypticola CBS 122712]
MGTRPNRRAAAVALHVQGTINVVSALCPTKSYLDFFIMLSSSAGVIANRRQANYAATNTFLDAFACQLMRGGYPATSISRESVLSVGGIAENQLRLSSALAYRALLEDLLFSGISYELCLGSIVDQLARIITFSVQEIDPQWSLGSYEVDSLVTVDLETWFL